MKTKNKNPKKRINSSWLLITIIILQFCIFPITTSDNISENKDNFDKSPDSQAFVSSDINYVHFIHRRGDSRILWDFNWDGMYSVSDANVMWHSFSLGTFLSDLSPLVSDSTEFESNVQVNGYNVESSNVVPYVVGSTYVDSYLLNHTTSGTPTPVQFSIEASDSVDFTASYFQNGGNFAVQDLNVDFEFDMSYHFEPILEIDSEYYNLGNIRVYAYSLLQGTTDFQWFEQDPNAIILNHPNYRYKILDKNTNEIIYEDFDDVIFQTYREIEIDSIKITNNAGEPVNITAKFNSGHYKGFQSWNEFQPHSTDNDIIPNGQTIPFIEPIIDGHRNVLTVDEINGNWEGIVWRDICTARAESTIEFWVNIEDSGKNLGVYLWAGTGSYLTILNFNGTTKTITLTGHITTLGTYECNRWMHVKIYTNSGTQTKIWLDDELIGDWATSFNTGVIDSLMFITDATLAGGKWYLDAIDSDLFDDDYYEGRNKEQNSSTELIDNWNSYPCYEDEGHFQGYESFNGYVDGSEPLKCMSGSSYSSYVRNSVLDGHSNYVNIAEAGHLHYEFADQDECSIEFYLRVEGGSGWQPQIRLGSGGYMYRNLGNLIWYDYGSGGPDYVIISSMNINQWYHIRATIDASSNIDFFIDGVDVGDYSCNSPDFEYLKFFSFSGCPDMYVDAIDYSWETNYYPMRSMITNTTYDSFECLQPEFNHLITPYTSILNNRTYNTTMYYTIDDLYSNQLENGSLFVNQTQLYYNSPNNRQCFISLADQRGNYLDYQNYKIYINDSIIYEQNFYREIDTSWNISIYSRFNKYITSSIHTVDRDDNYIPIALTLYSLKIYNQQPYFNWVNLSTNPYNSQYWSEYIAPNEIIEYRIPSGNYKLNVSNSETSTSTVYSYTLISDDILLITSSNTIQNMISNIENVNTTIGNQITNVAINLTNQNSNINNTIINIEINMDNMNSSLQTVLINQNTEINNLATEIDNFYWFTNQSLVNLNSSLDTLFFNQETQISSINSTISTLVVGIENEIHLLNATINNSFIQLSNDLLIMESNINTNFLSIENTIDLIGDNITSNYILINNSLDLISNDIGSNQVQMLNQLSLVNNSIMNFMSNLESQVYLINNSIYSVINTMSQSLTIDNNNIEGNLSVLLTQNEYLTQIYQKSMFSDFLNWTDASLNASYIENQIDVFEFINKYRNENVEVQLRYQDEVDELNVIAQQSKEQWLPKTNVEYRVISTSTGEELEEWQEIENETVEVGFYEETVPATPEDLDELYATSENKMADLYLLILIAVISLVVISVLYLKTKNSLNNDSDQEKKKRKDKDKKGVRNDSAWYTMGDERKSKNKSNGSVYAAVIISIIVLLTFFLLL